MEGSSRHSKGSQPHSTVSSKQIRSGYEPSDTESEWHESPWHDHPGQNKAAVDYDARKNISPLKLNWRHQPNVSPPAKGLVASPTRRRHTKSAYMPRRDDGNVITPPIPGSNINRNVSPLERRRHVSPYKAGRMDHDLNINDHVVISNRKQNHIYKHLGLEKGSKLLEFSKVSEKSNHSSRSLSATRPRSREKDQLKGYDHSERRGKRAQTPTASEINEMVANAKLSRLPVSEVAPKFESIESISSGNIFFSRDCTALALQKNSLNNEGNGNFERTCTPTKIITERDTVHHHLNRENGSFDISNQRNSSSIALSRTTMTSSSALSRVGSSKSTVSSKISDASGTSTVSLRKFTSNRRMSQTEAWFACMRKGPCRISKSPENRAFDEASFIEKAFVVENLRQFWADKHQPRSLNGFTCHKQIAQLLKQIVSHEIFPHILFKGPSGSGKKALTMALLSEIYGDPSWNTTNELRYFNIQGKGPKKVIVPLTSSAHHVELNVNLEQNAGYALMSLVKEISSNYAITPEISNCNFKAEYKVVVLYEVDKAAENIQHLIKWIIDCYSDACKLIICCEDDFDILEPVKNRCKVIKVDPPITHEIMEVLIQIARKEDFELSMNLAAKIATKSKQNLRKAIMALEACKAHSYPFVDNQPITLGWEEILVELASDILADPSPKRLFFIRGKFQKLLVDFVHPKLILQKLVEQFLKGVDAGIKRELYYWHAYYEKRLPTGTTALLKLEEFVAKFMSIYRKNFSNHRHA